MDFVEYMQHVFKWLVELFASYLSTMYEVITNTFENINLEIPRFDFSFDLRTYKTFRIVEKWFNKNSETLLIALAYSLMIFCVIKILWWCVCKRNQRSVSRGHKAARISEARRWYKQAELDHHASQNDMNVENPAYEWVCFKCQQASEKAIKAALMITYGPDLNRTKDAHDLTALCELLGDSTLLELADVLHGHVGIASRMRYPDMLPFPRVPRDVYSEGQAGEAWDVTRDILTHVQQHYINQQP